MIKLFEKHEDEKYIIIKILFIKITFKKKMSSINLGYVNKRLNNIQKEINISRQLYSKLLIENKFNNYKNIENNPYFSIIVPVYNTEKYLRRCLDSLVNQTFNDIEIIIVNDASQGNCKEIIEEYQKKDNRIKYIEHSENKSLLQARKTGNIASTGKYIMYVDSDDELDINTCQEIFNVIKNKDYDIIHFGTKIISDFDSKDIKWNLSTNRFNINSEFLLNEVIDKKISHNMWAKAFNINIIKKLIENISDIQIMNSEDMLQCLIAFYFAKSYKVIQKPLYIYYADIGVSNKNTNEIDIDKYDYLCRSTKIALDEFYNFLVKVKSNIAYGFLFSKIYYNQYNYLFEKIKNNNEEYIKIIEKYFDKSIISQYLHLQKYNEIENNNLEELNYKLSPYFFYIIFIDYKIIIKLFGIRIVIKNKECSNKIIVISLSNFLRRLFSINTKKIEGKKITFLNLLGFNFKF